jgi:hypothetical protein
MDPELDFDVARPNPNLLERAKELGMSFYLGETHTRLFSVRYFRFLELECL